MGDQLINHTPNTNTNTNTNTSSGVSSSSSSSSTSRDNRSNTSSEPVRSRWTPKPEQILILESIFNSGMVNPPKEETVRIRKLLEKFGAVGDANVFYWFQNRRSRSRRRQRQLQASLASSASAATATATIQSLNPPPNFLGGGGCGAIELYNYGNHQITCTATTPPVITSFAPPSSSSFGACVDDVYAAFSAQMSTLSSQQMDSCSSSTPIICPPDASNLDFQTGIITVFINGVATQIAEGALNMRAMFGDQVILVHSSGLPVPSNEYGISSHSLQHGESYFLVPRLT